MQKLTEVVFRYRDKIAVAIFLVILVCLIVGGGTFGLRRPAEDWMDALGILVAASGHALRLAALRQIGPRSRTTRHLGANRLVKEGPYAVVRNPLYVGNWLIALGLCIVAQLRWFIVAGPLLAFALYYLVVLAEERYLAAQFGAEFQSYCASTPRFFPRHLFRKRSQQAPPARTLAQCLLKTKEYQAFLATGICLLLIELVERLHAAGLLR